VADELELDSFALIGISCGGCTAARYAARNSGRVQRLVLYGSYPDGSAGDVAALVGGARFVELEGEAHLPWHGDADPVLAEVAPFLGFAGPGCGGPAGGAARHDVDAS
jgi:pimeloyl-ACP methyl ester carboxylesterase